MIWILGVYFLVFLQLEGVKVGGAGVRGTVHTKDQEWEVPAGRGKVDLKLMALEIDRGFSVNPNFAI